MIPVTQNPEARTSRCGHFANMPRFHPGYRPRRMPTRVRSLMVCFFFQDYFIWGETSEEIIEVYKYMHPPSNGPKLAEEVRRFIARYGQSEAELEAEFKRIFQPYITIHGGSGRTLRQELEDIRFILLDPNNPGRPKPD